MPPRHTYWTIILEGKPTAFRAHTREELMPTLRQLQARHPDAVMLWFARGRLWESPEQEREAMAARERRGGEHRERGWRPGGAHRDPRERFKVPRDEKRRRFAAKLRRDRPEGSAPGDPSERRPPSDRDRTRQDRAPHGKSSRPWQRRPEERGQRSWNQRPGPRRDRDRRDENKPAGERPLRGPRGGKPPRRRGGGGGSDR
jgi:hypothetical protein